MKTYRKSHKISVLSPEELKGVLILAADKSPRDHAMLLVQYFHALRASELVNLKLAQLDRRHEVWSLTVDRLKGSLETRQDIWTVKGKPVWNERRALENYLQNHRPKDAPTDAIFLSTKYDGPLDRSVWNRIFKQYAQDAGLPANLQHNHCLKHSRAVHMLEAGNSIDQVRQSLGHVSLASSLIYLLNTTDQRAQQAARSVLAFLP